MRLPVWELGLIILAPMAVAYLLRGRLEHALVDPLPAIKRSAAQFRMEFGLFSISGLIMALTLLFLFRFPFLHSGLKLMVGIVTAGLFAGLDMALARERLIIKASKNGHGNFDPPQRFSPLSRKLSLTATYILLLSTGLILLVLFRDIYWLAGHDLTMASVEELGIAIFTDVLFVMAFLLVMVINLVFSYARTLRLLFDTHTHVLAGVSKGDLSNRVPVTTSDELGVIAAHTNTMIDALQEGVRMREGLLIAQEVQHHFLPEKPPELPGLDIAGICRFSDETGGDFYDFIDCDLESCGQTAVTVGDVAGHGIGAALLMATGRAIIRQNAVLAATPAETVSQTNVHLTRDIGDTGRFMTLFHLVIDPVDSSMTWVNAGHQPPLIHDPADDTFFELKGEDIPLGVEINWKYHEYTMDALRPDQIMLVGTDGLWEAHNSAGKMFGKKHVERVLRANRHKNAQEIMAALCLAVREFTGLETQEDDITLVVLKGTSR